jgi:hypothetical protein
VRHALDGATQHGTGAQHARRTRIGADDQFRGRRGGKQVTQAGVVDTAAKISVRTTTDGSPMS